MKELMGNIKKYKLHLRAAAVPVYIDLCISDSVDTMPSLAWSSLTESVFPRFPSAAHLLLKILRLSSFYTSQQVQNARVLEELTFKLQRSLLGAISASNLE